MPNFGEGSHDLEQFHRYGLCGRAAKSLRHPSVSNHLKSDITFVQKGIVMSEKAEFWAPRDCLVPRIPELDLAVDSLAEAADAVLSADLHRARELLHQANLPILRKLAMRAMGALDPTIHRLRRIDMPPKAAKSELRMPGKTVADNTFGRDGWRCRFCGVRVVVPAARKVLSAAAPDALCWQEPTEGMHAAFLYASATLDHVVPHSYGGSNDPENLVTACWPCNFGRGGYLLQQMGLKDPRERPPSVDGWDGLTRLLRQAPPYARAVGEARRARPQTRRKSAISAPHWLSQVSGLADETPDRMLVFLASCEGLPVSWSARDVLLLRMSVGSRTLDVLGFERSGAVQIPWYIGDAKAAFRGFAEAVASVIPGAFAYETPKTWSVRHTDKRPVHVEELLASAKAIRDALEQLEADLIAMSPVADAAEI